MHRTFNMGLGLLLIVKREDTDKIMESLSSDKVKVYEVGQVVRGERKVKLIWSRILLELSRIFTRIFTRIISH